LLPPVSMPRDACSVNHEDSIKDPLRNKTDDNGLTNSV